MTNTYDPATIQILNITFIVATASMQNIYILGRGTKKLFYFTMNEFFFSLLVFPLRNKTKVTFTLIKTLWKA